MPLNIGLPLLPNNVIQVILCLNIIIFLSYVWYNICINSFLEIPTFSMYLVTIISQTWFTYLCNGKTRFLVCKAFLYVIGLMSIIFKQLFTAIWGTGYLYKYISPSPQNSSTVAFLSLYINLFVLGQLSSFQKKSSFSLLIVTHSPW